MASRFFVTIMTSGERPVLKLQEYGFDLFRPTARVNEKKEFTIEGLLTMEQVGRLVEDGYRVVVEEDSSKRARAKSGGIGFEEWLRGMEE